MSEKVVTPKDVLLGAANRLEKFGWCQGVSVNAKGECCLIGALSHGFDSEDNYPTLTRHYYYQRPSAVRQAITSAENSLRLNLRTTKGVTYDGLVEFNDAVGRTKEEVIAKLREVAASLDQESHNG